MNRRGIATILIPILLPFCAFAANPFLVAKDDKPVSANFRGVEWNDENIDGEIPLAARAVTTRIAQMPWGAVFKIEFGDLKSRAPEKREIRPDYFIVTDDRIVLLNEEDNEATAKKIASMDNPPQFEQGNIRAINSGKMSFAEGSYTTTIEVKGNECTYLTSHNSGHFATFVWEKGVGLVEHSTGYGAAKDGYRLKRSASTPKP
jgi:hypothetical protein